MYKTGISLRDATEDLINSLSVRHFDDSNAFEERYGEEIHDRFGGMIPIVRSFIWAVEAKEEKADEYRCKDCRQMPELFILKDSLWRKIADDKKDILCLRCCEIRLKRQLTIEDFNPDVPCNRIIFFAYSMARIKGLVGEE